MIIDFDTDAFPAVLGGDDREKVLRQFAWYLRNNDADEQTRREALALANMYRCFPSLSDWDMLRILHMSSHAWSYTRSLIRERCDGICERCNAREYQDTHHLTYVRLGHERLEDLQGLCRGCHSFVGGWSKVDPRAMTPHPLDLRIRLIELDGPI